MGVVHPGGAAGVRDRWLAAILVAFVAGSLLAGSPGGATTSDDDAVRLVPQSPRPGGTCVPFGRNTGVGFAGFIYRNVPAFSLKVGDIFAVDLRAPNDVDLRRNIYFAPANINPQPTNSTSQGVRAVAWTQVVSDEQVPVNPRGNDIVGDYEVTYMAEADFDFAGGGFILGVRLGDYRDPHCFTPTQVHTTQSDPSGHFYARFRDHPDLTLGVLDSGNWGTDLIGGIVLYPSPGSVPTTVVSAWPSSDVDGWYEPPAVIDLEATSGSDVYGVREIRWSLNAGEEQVVPQDTATVVIDQAGVHELRFYAVDEAGNMEAPNAVEVRVLQTVGLEMVPGSPVTPINVRRGGPVAVSALSAPGLDATTMDAGSVTFGATGHETVPLDCGDSRDVNRDGLMDLQCRFDVALAGFSLQDSEAVLLGWADGVRVRGTAPVRILGR